MDVFNHFSCSTQVLYMEGNSIIKHLDFFKNNICQLHNSKIAHFFVKKIRNFQAIRKLFIPIRCKVAVECH